VLLKYNKLTRRPETKYRKALQSEVLSWTIQKKSVPIQLGANSGDDPMGEDYFSTQQTYVKPNGDVAGPDEIELPLSLLDGSSTKQDSIEKDVKFLDCSEFVQYVHLMTDMSSKKAYLKVNGPKGKDINVKTVQLDAKSFVNDSKDDIELSDWAYSNMRAKIWFCENISQPTILLKAICDILGNKCETRYETGFMFRTGQALKFLGFVSAATDANKVETFHIKSFVIYETCSSNPDVTTVHCILTARHLIAANMQERLLQIMQIMQYRHTNTWKVRISSQGINLSMLCDRSHDALTSMNFQVTDQDTYFEAFTSHPIPTAAMLCPDRHMR
jgi:hypothetical protein